MPLYQPEKTVTGSAYSLWFKAVATVVFLSIAAYGLSVALRFPIMQYSTGIKLLLLGAALMLGVSYYWFLRSVTMIDATGIHQTGMYNKKVEWHDVIGAKMIGIPYFAWIFPPRLVVRSGKAFVTFNGGTRDVLVEFAKISVAFHMKR